MPLDPSIILGVKPLNLAQPDPIERFTKLAGVQEITGKLADQEQARADDQATREAFKAGGTGSEVLDRLRRVSPKAAMAYEKHLLEGREKEANIGAKTSETKKREYDMALDRTSRMASIFASATDQPSWDAARRNMAVSFGPEAIANVPERYDPQYQRTKVAEGQTITQYLTDQRARETQAETGRHNLQTETTQRGQLGVSQATLGETKRHHGVTEGNDAVQYITTPEGVVAVPKRPAAGQAPTGQFVVDASGKPLAGKGSDKPLNDSQAKALLYSNRMAEADQIINDLSAKGTNVGIPGIGKPGAINAISPEAQQSLIQAKRNFINAVLRRESGAVISPSEMAEADKQYFPQVGEGANIIKQKAANRKTAMAGIQAEVPMQHRPTAAPAAGAPGAAQETRTVGGKTYVKVNGQWFEQ